MEAKLATSEVLAKAADLIEPEGRWIQGALTGDRDGRPSHGAVTGADFCAHCWCVFGAIQKAGWLVAREADKFEPSRLHSFHRQEPAAVGFVMQALGEPDADIFEWNDSKRRTQAQVVAALRKASKLAKVAGQ